MNRYVAEFIGAFVLVFGGCGTGLISGASIGVTGVALAFGFSLVAMAFTVGPVSGCHINPAVTIGCVIAKKLDAKYAAGYIIAQVLGAVAASGLLYLVLKDVAGQNVLEGVANGYAEHSPTAVKYAMMPAFLVEMIGTFFLVYTVLGTTDIKAPVGFAGIPIGFVLVLILSFAIPVTNASINPARSVGPAIFVGGWALSQLWLFIVAPIAGGIIAAIVYGFTHKPEVSISVKRAEQALPSEQAERRQ